ncbi:CocE/NonD family hydrolase, partial [Candidatus Omnitrophota bacterium]
ESFRQLDNFPYEYLSPRTYAALCEAFAEVRTLPASASLELCRVAIGEYVLHMLPAPIKVWDLIPGIFIATKAGAQAVYPGGEEFFPVRVERDKKEPRISGQVIVGPQAAVDFARGVVVQDKTQKVKVIQKLIEKGQFLKVHGQVDEAIAVLKEAYGKAEIILGIDEIRLSIVRALVEAYITKEATLQKDTTAFLEVRVEHFRLVAEMFDLDGFEKDARYYREESARLAAELAERKRGAIPRPNGFTLLFVLSLLTAPGIFVATLLLPESTASVARSLFVIMGFAGILLVALLEARGFIRAGPVKALHILISKIQSLLGSFLSACRSAFPWLGAFRQAGNSLKAIFTRRFKGSDTAGASPATFRAVHEPLELSGTRTHEHTSTRHTTQETRVQDYTIEDKGLSIRGLEVASQRLPMPEGPLFLQKHTKPQMTRRGFLGLTGMAAAVAVAPAVLTSCAGTAQRSGSGRSLSDENQALAEKIKRLVEQYNYSFLVAQEFVDVFLPAIAGWKQEVDSAKEYYKGSRSRDQLIDYQALIVEKIARTLTQAIHSGGYFELYDIIQKREANNLGYIQLFSIVARSVGLREITIAQCEDHLASLVALNGNTVVYVNLTIGHVSRPFNLKEEYKGRKLRTRKDKRDDSLGYLPEVFRELTKEKMLAEMYTARAIVRAVEAIYFNDRTGSMTIVDPVAFKAAEDEFARALEVDKECVKAYDVLAMIYSGLSVGRQRYGSAREASQLRRTGGRLYHKYKELSEKLWGDDNYLSRQYFGLGEAHLVLRHPYEAYAYYNRALVLNPSLVEAQRRMEWIIDQLGYMPGSEQAHGKDRRKRGLKRKLERRFNKYGKKVMRKVADEDGNSKLKVEMDEATLKKISETLQSLKGKDGGFTLVETMVVVLSILGIGLVVLAPGLGMIRSIGLGIIAFVITLMLISVGFAREPTGRRYDTRAHDTRHTRQKNIPQATALQSLALLSVIVGSMFGKAMAATPQMTMLPNVTPVASSTASSVGVEEELKVVVERNVPVPMRDGTILRADVYRPDRGGPYPVLVCLGVTEAHRGYRGSGIIPFVKAGYIVVEQALRWEMYSEGEGDYLRLMRKQAEDGYDAVEWAANLPNSSHKVGTFGRSGTALPQWLVAPLRPPSLVAMSARSIWAKRDNWELPGTIRPYFMLRGVFTYFAPRGRQRGNTPGVHTSWEAIRLWDQSEWEKWVKFEPRLDIPQEFWGSRANFIKQLLTRPDFYLGNKAEGCKNISVPNFDIVGWFDYNNNNMVL